MNNQTFYGAMRDDRLLEGTISTNESVTNDLAYQQAYNDASDDLADDHLLGPESDVDAKINEKWYYEVVKFNQAELIEAIEDAQSTYGDFCEETPKEVIQNVLN